MPPPTLHGAGVILSAPEAADHAPLLALYTANEGTLNIPSPYTAPDGDAYLAAAARSEGGHIWAIRAADGAELIGTVALRFSPGARTADLGGIAVAEEYRGTGLATRAAALVIQHAWDAGFDAVEWECLAHNEASVALARRLGFAFYREGVSSSSFERYRGAPAVWGLLRRPGPLP
ncbi:hypothetical protein Q8F55_001762 [Vanrija albida]|uniref:N-acetyltransferase domain-containing protein n=1 Tax=Vanrija albida TaxID=181172 RepID=A0ABR3Q7W8_9TREE